MENPEESAKPPKRPRTSRQQDIRNLLAGKEEENHVKGHHDHPQDSTQAPKPTKVHLGPEEKIELEDWEEKFREHIEQTKKMEKEAEERIERKLKKESSWQLLRECTTFLKENEKGWKIEDQKNCKEAKKTRLKRAEQQKKETLSTLQQKKITESWSRLPGHEQRRCKIENGWRK